MFWWSRCFRRNFLDLAIWWYGFVITWTCQLSKCRKTSQYYLRAERVEIWPISLNFSNMLPVQSYIFIHSLPVFTTRWPIQFLFYFKPLCRTNLFASGKTKRWMIWSQVFFNSRRTRVIHHLSFALNKNLQQHVVPLPILVEKKTWVVALPMSMTMSWLVETTQKLNI